MKTLRLLSSLLTIAALCSQVAQAADDLEALAGKWSVKKTNAGREFTQTITVKQNKFVFEMLGGDDQVVLHAEGDLKLDKLGPFSAAHFVNIRAGRSADELQDVDDEYTSIYRLEADTWTMAVNFDKDRDQMKPGVDNYQRTKSTGEAVTLVVDEIAMADTPQSATWYLCFEVKTEGVPRSYRFQGKAYDKNQITIPMALELPKVKAGQKCTFKLQLDDVEDDVCTDEVDNRSTGEFVASPKGEQTFKPEDNWRYTIRWHLK